MKKEIELEGVGTIVAKYNFFTGRVVPFLNGARLKKISKNTYSVPNPETGRADIIVSVIGNDLRGISVVVRGKTYFVVPAIPWYCFVLAVLGFVATMTWSMVPACVNIFPMVGGAIGGAIGGLLAGLYLYLVRVTDKAWARILIWVAFFVADVMLRFGVALMILGA